MKNNIYTIILTFLVILLYTGCSVKISNKRSYKFSTKKTIEKLGIPAYGTKVIVLKINNSSLNHQELLSIFNKNFKIQFKHSYIEESFNFDNFSLSYARLHTKYFTNKYEIIDNSIVMTYTTKYHYGGEYEVDNYLRELKINNNNIKQNYMKFVNEYVKNKILFEKEKKIQHGYAIKFNFVKNNLITKEFQRTISSKCIVKVFDFDVHGHALNYQSKKYTSIQKYLQDTTYYAHIICKKNTYLGKFKLILNHKINNKITFYDIKKGVDINIDTVAYNFIPNTFNTKDKNIKIVLNGTDLKIINNTKKFLDISKISFYYNGNIYTKNVNINMPPESEENYNVNNFSNFKNPYVKLKSKKQKATFGIAINYLNVDTNKRFTLYNTKKYSIK